MNFIKAKIVDIKRLTHDTKSLLIRLEEGKHIQFTAGQFVTIHAIINDENVTRPYSIASPPPHDLKHAEYIELIIKKVPGGKMTTYLHSLHPGAELDIRGPFGRLGLKEPIQEGDIFMATGSGIAPFMSMLRKVFRDHNPKKFYLFYGVRNMEEIIYGYELKLWDKEHENFKFIICLSKPENGWDGEVGYVQDKLATYVKDFKGKQAYLCGLPAMIEQSKQRLIELGVKPENIYYESY